MVKPSLLIIGGGGYIQAVVLPILRKHFPQVDVHLMLRSPAKTLKTALQFGIHAGTSFEGHTHYFLAVPPCDYAYYVKKIPMGARIWLEKPLCGLDLASYKEIESTLLPNVNRFYIGYNKRQIVPRLPTTFQNISLSLQTENYQQNSWKHFLCEGGIQWIDGCHLFDLALFLLGTDATVSIDLSQAFWQSTVIKGEQKIEITVGPSCKTHMTLDGTPIDLFSPRASHEFFKLAFGEFLAEKSNAVSCLKTTFKILETTLSNQALC